MKKDLVDHNKPTISELFSNKKYKIPKYQRAFSWDKEKAEQFFDDIFTSGGDGDYFLGSLLFNNKDGFYEVIDGQQRLTTASLLIFSFYLVYKEINEGDASVHIYKYLKSGDLTEKYNVLSLSRKNEDFYNQILNIKSIEDISSLSSEDKSNNNLIEIIKIFISKIKHNHETDIHLEQKRLSELFGKFVNKVFFIELIVSDYREASKLFEVLNNRGTDLTEADLIRNYLLSELERQGLYDESTMSSWEEIEAKIDSSNLEQFFRYGSLLISKKADLYDRIVEYTEKTSSKTVVNLISDLSKQYLNIVDPESYNENAESRILQELNILGSTQSRSILLAAYNKFSGEEIFDIAKFLLGFTLKYSISDKNPNKLEAKYADLSYRIYNEELTADEVKTEIRTLEPKDQEFDEAFLNKEFKSAKLPRYILGKIENHISSEEKIVDFSSVDLEHIMPKKIDKWISSDRSYIDIHKKFKDNIGNMVILSKKLNASIKNNIFASKKEKYDDSEINLVKEIKSKEKWTDAEIKENARRYLDLVKKVWSL
jgi:uncharacterized protein with ParB-like and HNH nuclease domain